MKSLIKIVLVLIAGILIYNYFLGDAEEKAQSEKIFQEVKDLGVAVKDVLKQEHQKFREGKYDEVLDNLKSAFEKLRDKFKDADPDILDKLDRLQEKRDTLAEQLDDAEAQEGETREEEINRLKIEIKKLLDETAQLAENND